MPTLPRPVVNPVLPAALALAVTLTLTACGTDPAPSPATRTAPPPSAGPVLAVDVPILGKVHGDQLATDDYGVKMMDVAALAGTGLEQAFAAAGIELDPALHSVVLLALGEQSQGGYTVDITALQHKGGTLYVQGIAQQPAEDADAPTKSTRPFAAVAIDRVPLGTVVRSDIQ